MLRPLPLPMLGLGAFGLFATLAGLVLLMAANHAAPGCTGPAVQRCDYAAVARAAVARSEYRPYSQDLGFEIFDEGSSVRVQQFTPPGEPGLNHAASVLIDRRSCRVCQIGYQTYDNAPLLARIPAEDTEAAARRTEAWKDGPGGIALL